MDPQYETSLFLSLLVFTLFFLIEKLLKAILFLFESQLNNTCLLFMIFTQCKFKFDSI
jgi:hypothetical protein